MAQSTSSRGPGPSGDRPDRRTEDTPLPREDSACQCPAAGNLTAFQTHSGWRSHAQRGLDLEEATQVRHLRRESRIDVLGEMVEGLDDHIQATRAPLGAPGPECATVHEQGWAQQSTSGVNAFRVLGRHDQFPTSVAEQIWVIAGHEVDYR